MLSLYTVFKCISILGSVLDSSFLFKLETVYFDMQHTDETSMLLPITW